MTGTKAKDSIVQYWTDKDGTPPDGIGVCDGVNNSFPLSYIPDPIRTKVYLNGLHQRLNFDYKLNGKVLSFTPNPPPANSTIDVDGCGVFNV